MKKRFLGMVTAGILATVMLAGCGASASKVTAESLLQEVQSKCDAMKSLETHTTAEITLESDALGGTMDMTMDMTMQTTIEPVANYLKGNINIPGLGTAMDGTEAYMISGSISGADVKNLLSSMESTLGGLTGDTEMNLDDITVDFTYAVSKADKMPLYMDMVFSGLGAGEGDEQVTFSKFNMKMEYTNYDTVEAITVPQDVVDSAIDVTDYLNDLQNETSSDTESETAA